MHIRHHTPHVPHTAPTDPWAATEAGTATGIEIPEESGPISATATETAPESGPVFVDSTGRRAKILRRAGLAFAAACACYTGALALSLTGATPIAPRTLLPLPGVPASVPDAESAAGVADAAADVPVGAPAQGQSQVPFFPTPALPRTVPVVLRTKAPVVPPAPGLAPPPSPSAVAPAPSAAPSVAPSATQSASAPPSAPSAPPSPAPASPSATEPAAAPDPSGSETASAPATGSAPPQGSV